MALGGLTDYDWDLTIFGDGPDRQKIEALVPDSVRTRVHWRGWSPGPDEALRHADLLCVPSTNEALPLVVLEAMARGVPVIASGVCCVPDILAHGDCGIVVPSASVGDWTKALEQVFNAPHALKDLAIKARLRWADRYSSNRMVDQYAELINQAPVNHAPVTSAASR
jgi:glycosyltransferase involved in cell wall biosynthesis